MPLEDLEEYGSDSDSSGHTSNSVDEPKTPQYDRCWACEEDSEGRVGGFRSASASTSKRPVMPFRGLVETSNTKMIGEFQTPPV